MLLLMCYDYDQYNIVLIISFAIIIYQSAAKFIVRYTIHLFKDMPESQSLAACYRSLHHYCHTVRFSPIPHSSCHTLSKRK